MKFSLANQKLVLDTPSYSHRETDSDMWLNSRPGVSDNTQECYTHKLLMIQLSNSDD